MPHRLSRRHVMQGVGAVGLGLLAGCGRLPWQVQAPAKLPRIGYLGLGSSGPNPGVEAFRQGLRDLDYIEGQNIVVDYRLADGRAERLPGFAAELLQLPVDVLYTSSTPAALVAKEATTSTPIVITAIGDPVALGIVASLRRTGGNITGVSNLAPQLSGKRLELLRDTLGGISRVAILVNAAVADRAMELRETERAAQVLGIELQVVQVRGPDEFEGAFARMAEGGAEALSVLEDALLYTLRPNGPIVTLAAQYRLPAIYSLREMVDGGGLMAYGASFIGAHRRAAAYVDKLLKGAKPADLPIEQPMTFDLVINLRTAQALGLAIPDSVLQQATELIQ
jgi:putative tryptophan/tyrosine transport system substrate-binding protein